MNIMDLKLNIMDTNLSLEKILAHNERLPYTKPTGFIFSNKTYKWRMMKNGLGNIKVPPLFQEEICPPGEAIMLELAERFKINNYDSELINLYQILKNNLFLVAKKLLDLDQEEERKGLFYLTYEQLINTILFYDFHIYCITIDINIYSGILDEDRPKYHLILDQLEYIKERSQCTEWMLLKACRVAKFKISPSLLELIQKDDTIEDCRSILSLQMKLGA